MSLDLHSPEQWANKLALNLIPSIWNLTYELLDIDNSNIKVLGKLLILMSHYNHVKDILIDYESF